MQLGTLAFYSVKWEPLERLDLTHSELQQQRPKQDREWWRASRWTVWRSVGEKAGHQLHERNPGGAKVSGRIIGRGKGGSQ